MCVHAHHYSSFSPNPLLSYAQLSSLKFRFSFFIPPVSLNWLICIKLWHLQTWIRQWTECPNLLHYPSDFIRQHRAMCFHKPLTYTLLTLTPKCLAFTDNERYTVELIKYVRFQAIRSKCPVYTVCSLLRINVILRNVSLHIQIYCFQIINSYQMSGIFS